MDRTGATRVYIAMRHLACAALALLTLVLAGRPAQADDEGSEHTAGLYGAPADTAGVMMTWSDKTGWSLAVRARPGADEKTTVLPLPKIHAHYAVFVAPRRTAIAIVELSAGIRDTRPSLAAADGLAWVFAPDGKLLARWTYGQVLTKGELATPARSASHLRWTSDVKASPKGLSFAIAHATRSLTLDAAAHTLR